ncbi:Putative gamma-glutamyl cyclotransferase, protein AIG2 [Septoria linicola]|uniref:Putative gamma-glutamylcyclotransferase n=1 Tax=Septoria linicola TaxID=215465 RepID=A0A9Q9AL86_9PEZI|nr:Putative gamma-glutamyl cyclotransferase, protein AIG2 [Septoria linicola]
MSSTTSSEPSAQNLGRTAFFYGTLMSPKVLHRVCHGDMSPSNPIFASHNLKIYPAILHGHRRHRVLGADYPGVVPNKDATVRGTYVTGLTDADIFRLDLFEGSEYTRQKVMVKVLEEAGDAESGEGNIEGKEVPAETYIYTASADNLEDREWDFAEFRRDKERYWVGVEEIDEIVAAPQNDGTGGRGASGGFITDALLEEQKKSA